MGLLENELLKAIDEVNGQTKVPRPRNTTEANFSVEKADKRGKRPKGNGNDIAVGDEDDEIDESSGPVQPRTNERGIQKILAAAIIGVQAASITNWIRSGRIQLTHDDFVPIREVRRMTIEVNLQKNRGQHADGGTADVLAKNRLESAKADIAELDLEEKRASLVNRNSARRAFEEAAVVTKQRVLACVETIVAEVTGKKDPNVIGNIVRKHLTNTLITLSKGVKLGDEVALKSDTDGEDGAG